MGLGVFRRFWGFLGLLVSFGWVGSIAVFGSFGGLWVWMSGLGFERVLLCWCFDDSWLGISV